MKKHSDAELDNLHLSDDIIELLWDGRVDIPLLCGLAVRKDFGNMLAGGVWQYGQSAI